jgi:hypothetical protein
MTVPPASYRRGDRRVAISARITRDQLEHLDAYARRRGITRSAAVAMLVDRLPLFGSTPGTPNVRITNTRSALRVRRGSSELPE